MSVVQRQPARCARAATNSVCTQHSQHASRQTTLVSSGQHATVAYRHAKHSNFKYDETQVLELQAHCMLSMLSLWYVLQHAMMRMRSCCKHTIILLRPLHQEHQTSLLDGQALCNNARSQHAKPFWFQNSAPPQSLHRMYRYDKIKKI